MTLPKDVAELQHENVLFELECIDRMYLNLYVPQLTSAQGVAAYFRGYKGHRFGMNWFLSANRPTRQLNRSICNDLIGIHVGLCARTSLETLRPRGRRSLPARHEHSKRLFLLVTSRVPHSPKPHAS